MGKKADKKATTAFRSKDRNGAGRQGIGYFVPPTVTKEQWRRLKKQWERKLKNAKFNDIEQFSHDCSGHFSPYFTKSAHSNSVSGSSASAIRYYSPHTLEYYRRVGLFLHHAPLWKLFGQGKGGVRQYWLTWHILKLLSEGATYQAIADFFGSTKCPPSLRGKRSYFFAYHHIERPTNKRAINRIMAQWWSENRELMDGDE